MAHARRNRSSAAALRSHSAIQGLKLPFQVVFASSADDGFDARQLEAKSAAAGDEPKQQQTHIKGWQSAKYSSYPQTLVLRFPGYFDIRKIQILSHQSKIANTIELYAGVTQSLDEPDDQRADYARLGYLSLDSNERSGFKARELKSVYVNARGNFLKLTIRKAHTNQINQFNQVGIIAINVVGTRATDPHPAQLPHGSGQQAAAAAASAGDTSHRSVLAGLIAQYQCDEKTAQKIYDLERLKAQAVAAEEYDEAKRLKIHVDTLKELSGKLAQLEQQKIQAVQREDFDLAKQIKREIDYLRGNAAHAHQQQQRGPPQHMQPQQQQQMSRAPSQKLSVAMNRRGSGDYPPQPQYDPPHDAYDPPMSLQQDGGHHDEPHPDHHHGPPHDDDGYGQAAGAPPPQAHEDDFANGDDRPIKPSRNAMANMQGAGGELDDGSSPNHAQTRKPAMHAASYDPTDDDEGANAVNSSSLPPPEQLTAVNRKDAEPLLDIFGEHAVLSLYSKHWQLRQSALKDMTQSIADNSNDVPLRDLFLASCRVLKKGLGDKVSQVFLSACQLLQTLLSTHAMKLRPDEVRAMLEPLVHTMLDKLSSSNVRERDGGMQVLAFLAFDSHVHPSLVPAAMLQPLKKKEVDSPLPLKGRAKLLLRCVIFYGLDDSFFLSMPGLVKFVSPHLLHRDAGVRDGMFNLLAAMSSLAGMTPAKVLAQLKDIRPQTMETLQQKMDDVASGAMQFTKPAQPSLDVPYISEQDSTHTLHGQPVTGPAGVSAPSAPVAASSAVSSGYMAAAAAPPAKAKQGGAPAPAAHGKHAHANPQQQQQQQPQKQSAGKPQSHQSPPPAAHHPHAVDSSIAEEELSADLSGKCQFCGVEDPTFTEEKLDLHYWQDCPILISCKQCEQVIEIPTLAEHLMHECEAPGGYKACPQCQQPILASQFAAHTDARNCRPPAAGHARCALCEQDVDKSDEGWKQHLLVDTCPKNTRPVK